MKSHYSIGLDLGEAQDSCHRPYLLLGLATVLSRPRRLLVGRHHADWNRHSEEFYGKTMEAAPFLFFVNRIAPLMRPGHGC